MEEVVSNLYMTTEEFAAMIVDTLDEQNYFKKGTKNHPVDIVIAFVSTAETIASTIDWAIGKEQSVKLKEKLGVMANGDLNKNTSGSWSTSSSSTTNPTVVTQNHSYGHTHILPEDDEIAPALLEKEEPLVTPRDALEYSEWKSKGYL
jgi:hypothetical protein